MATVEGAARQAVAGRALREQLSKEVEEEYVKLEGRDLQRALAELIVKLRYQRCACNSQNLFTNVAIRPRY
jgi:hypothetical protein